MCPDKGPDASRSIWQRMQPDDYSHGNGKNRSWTFYKNHTQSEPVEVIIGAFVAEPLIAGRGYLMSGLLYAYTTGDGSGSVQGTRRMGLY